MDYGDYFPDGNGFEKETTVKKDEKKKHVWRAYVEPVDLAAPLHTALRKCCDSKPTSALWNLIYVCDDGWGWYLEQFHKRLKKAETEEGVIRAAKKAATCTDLSTAEGEYEVVPDGMRHEVYGLLCVMAMFDEHDWAGFISFIVE